MYDFTFWDLNDDPLQKLVLSYIYYRKNNLWISLGYFSMKVGIDSKELKKILKILKSDNFISIERHPSDGKYSSCRIYKILRPYLPRNDLST